MEKITKAIVRSVVMLVACLAITVNANAQTGSHAERVDSIVEAVLDFQPDTTRVFASMSFAEASEMGIGDEERMAGFLLRLEDVRSRMELSTSARKCDALVEGAALAGDGYVLAAQAMVNYTRFRMDPPSPPPGSSRAEVDAAAANMVEAWRDLRTACREALIAMREEVAMLGC